MFVVAIVASVVLAILKIAGTVVLSWYLVLLPLVIYGAIWLFLLLLAAFMFMVGIVVVALGGSVKHRKW